MLDVSIMLLIIAVMIMAVMGYVIWKLINQQRKIQPMTKNQYERLNADNIVSAKLNRMGRAKWIGITGDGSYPPIAKYMKYKGSNADSRMIDFLVKRGRNPLRWFIVPWCLVENLSGKTVWIKCNGFRKTDYFFRPIVSPDTIMADGKKWEEYDKEIDEHIKILLHTQGTQDMLEQIMYESLISATHGERASSDIQQKQETPQVTESEEYQPELEG